MSGDSTALKAALTETQELPARDNDNIVTRRIWLPKALYDALPYFYIVSGVIALLTTLYINSWFWVLPHYVLFSAACLHFGVVIYRRRHRKRPQA